jgi:glycosyltransferase involved in cell wall biosynthesis
MSSEQVAALADLVAASKIRRIKVVAWRDLDDPEAGGSELHAAEVLRRWAAAGLEITQRTSAVAGLPQTTHRDGYTAIRKDGRYRVFAEVFREGLRDARREYDGLIEIWNGMPFFGPVWFRGPRSVWLHHVHGEMWQMTLPGLLGRIGWFIEHRLAPLFYRRSSVATLSSSSEEEIHERLGLRRTSVIPPGISDFFKPGTSKALDPLVVAVGRLVPVKRFDLLVRSFALVHQSVPSARLVIAGEGYLRNELEELIREIGASEYVSLVGRVDDEELRRLYQQAWLVSSASLREGWGMSLTEAAACGTPVVASDIAGHRDAVSDNRSGLLVSDDEIGTGIIRVLSDSALREKLSAGALEYAAELSWDNTALRLFDLLNRS